MVHPMATHLGGHLADVDSLRRLTTQRGGGPIKPTYYSVLGVLDLQRIEVITDLGEIGYRRLNSVAG